MALSSSVVSAPSVAESVEKVRLEWLANWNAKNLKGVMALYADDAVLLPSSGERITGKAKIGEYFKSIFDSPWLISRRLDSQNTVSSGDLAYDSGSWSQTGKRTVHGGGTSETHGSFLVVLRREAEKWLIVQQASTASQIVSATQ